MKMDIKKLLAVALLTVIPTTLYAATDVNADFIFTKSNINAVAIGNVLTSGSLDNAALQSTGVKILDITLDNNNYTGFSLTVYASGAMKLYNGATALYDPLKPGTSLPYTIDMVDVATGVLGTTAPTYPTGFTGTPNQIVNFNTGVSQATVGKKYDFNVKASAIDLAKLLTKSGYTYKDNFRVVIADL